MQDPRPQIVSFGGGGFSMESGNPLLDDYVLGLAAEKAAGAGRERPRVCFLPTASGDADHYVVRFYRAFEAARCEPSHISLFRRERGAEDLREHLLAQDLIYVGGGSVVSMLGTWRAHGLDRVIAEAWRSGTILCGLSAGSLCWFAEAFTNFHGQARVVRGLGLLPWSNSVHHGDEEGRRHGYHEAMKRGMCPGYAVGDGAALHFVGPRMVHAISSRPKAQAWSVGWHQGEIRETPLAVSYLGTEAGPVLETA